MERKKGSRTRPRRNTQPGDLETLNFKVPDAFKRTYKGYAAMQGMTMLELLKEGFELSKQKRGRSQ
jgi:hypothetical protein